MFEKCGKILDELNHNEQLKMSPVSDVVWRIKSSRRQCPGIHVQRLAKIFCIMSAVKGKWDEKQEKVHMFIRG
jgi:hypothetical protein